MCVLVESLKNEGSCPICREKKEKLVDIKSNIRDIVVVSFSLSLVSNAQVTQVVCFLRR